MVLVGSNTFSVVFSSCMFSVFLYGCHGFSVALVGSRRFSVILVDSQWFSVVLPVSCRRVSMVLVGSQ